MPLTGAVGVSASASSEPVAFAGMAGARSAVGDQLTVLRQAGGTQPGAVAPHALHRSAEAVHAEHRADPAVAERGQMRNELRGRLLVLAAHLVELASTKRSSSRTGVS